MGRRVFDPEVVYKFGIELRAKPPFGPYNSIEEVPEDQRRFYYLGDKFRHIDTIDFVEQPMAGGRWTVKIPGFLARYHDWFPFWEQESYISMAEHLKPGMTLYDIGTFDGWQACLFAQMVGAENMVLVEPVPEMWPNTKLTWEANELAAPKATFIGFAGDYDTKQPMVYINGWPQGPDYDYILKAIKFRLMHEQTHVDNTECLKIDTLSGRVGLPDGLHIDVEGAELKVLKGAEHVLKTKHPYVWIAVHPDFMRDRFRTHPEELLEYMKNLGYQHQFLAKDHEEHHFFF